MTFSRILVAVDETRQAQAALELAAGLAAEQQALLTLVTVIDRPAAISAPPDVIVDPTIDERIDAEAKALLASAEQIAAQHGAQVRTVLREGDVVDAILAAIDEHHADLVVLGTHGRTGLTRALEGSVAERVLRATTIPVLIAHASA
jgi:nucleotide-binding universal stress UspA family protein